MFEDIRQTDYKSHIKALYSPEILKALFIHALQIDIEDNNDKVPIVQRLLGSQFAELGTGTNRYSTSAPDGYCHKIALDRRGIVDNMTEFRRSPEIEFCAPRAYECNGVVLVAEDVSLISLEDFMANKDIVLEICGELAKTYIFTDIGYATKNYCNWGIRRNGDLVILDTGYIIPRLGNEQALRCPLCGEEIRYNQLYTGFICSNKHCQTEYSFADIFRRLKTDSLENKLFEAMAGFELPDLSHINDTLYNDGIVGVDHDSEKKEESGDDEDSGAVRIEDSEDLFKQLTDF